MKSHSASWGPATKSIHAGDAPKQGVAGPVATPIARTSTFTFSSAEEMRRWAQGKSREHIYTRYGNPTEDVAERRLAELEHAEAALVTASGMSAIASGLLSVLRSGDEVIATQSLYGGSYRLMRDVFPRLGIRVHHIGTDLSGFAERVNKRTRVFYTESPTNPTLRIVDLRRAATLARKHRLVAMIDNTLASPLLQNPLDYGFDLSLHSATKYLNGHSDLIVGALAGSRRLVEEARHTVIAMGGSVDPDVAYMLIRGMKTLDVRMKKHCTNAMAVARFLARHPKVKRVHYPGLRTHPDHKLAARQMRGFGGMVSFDLKGGEAAARRFGNRIRLFLLAVSLGGVESLCALPIYTSHYNMTAAEIAAHGVEPGTVRLSIGIEDATDLIEDLRQALR
jgi:cystathionine beta-lyase/cystathionine gamma-synthase